MRPILLAVLFGTAAAPAIAQNVPVPAAITTEGVPAIPAALAEKVRPYLENRTAAFQGWDPKSHGMLIATRFGNAPQLHLVAMPGGARTQLSFEAEPVPGGQFAPDGSTIAVVKDKGGDEFFQICTLDAGRLHLLSDGKSRNTGPVWSRDGKTIGYASSRRNGTDSDLYLVNPADPKSDHLLAEVQGGGWSFGDFAPGGGKALVEQGLSVERSNLYEVDLATGRLSRLNRPGSDASFENPRYGADGIIYLISDTGSDVRRLGTIDATNGFRPLTPAPAAWDVEAFDIAPDASFLAVVTNEAGLSKLRLIDPKTGTARAVNLPAGVITGLEIAPWGDIGFSLASARSPADAWSVDPKTLLATRWTHSETGGLEPAANREPELVTVKSFDGQAISGFLYTPDPARFPGKRPLIVDIHGGPEGQTRPGFLGRGNYLINELGLAVFYPNVRGSTGYGKRFVGLDNGPYKREDSVKDIGAVLDTLTARADVDAGHVAVTGGSYGGYMCYASAIRFGNRLQAAQCTVAISNFVTFLENTQGYRRDLRRIEYGDERNPGQRLQLTAISPLTHARELHIPLLVVTGGNDPRVPPSEAAQMVAAVRGNGGTAWHILAANEGHGYRKKENQDYQFLATLAFWQATLLK